MNSLYISSPAFPSAASEISSGSLYRDHRTDNPNILQNSLYVGIVRFCISINILLRIRINLLFLIGWVITDSDYDFWHGDCEILFTLKKEINM